MHERLPCEQIEVGTAEFLDGALPRDLHRRFEAHVRICEECRAQIRSIGRTSGRLAKLPRETMPLPMKMRLLRARSSPPPPQPVLLHRRAPPVPSAEADD